MSPDPDGEPVYTISQVAKIMGVSYGYVDRQRAKGLGWRLDRHGHRVVPKSELVRWMLAVGLTKDQVRDRLRPTTGCVVLAGCPEGVVEALSELDPVTAHNTFGLGMAMGDKERPAWAVVVDLAGFGRALAVDTLAAIAPHPGRPHLVAVVDAADVEAEDRLADVFDLLVPRVSGARRLLSALVRLRRFGVDKN